MNHSKIEKALAKGAKVELSKEKLQIIKYSDMTPQEKSDWYIERRSKEFGVSYQTSHMMLKTVQHLIMSDIANGRINR